MEELVNEEADDRRGLTRRATRPRGFSGERLEWLFLRRREGGEGEGRCRAPILSRNCKLNIDRGRFVVTASSIKSSELSSFLFFISFSRRDG